MWYTCDVYKCYCCNAEYKAEINIKGFAKCPYCSVFFNAKTQNNIGVRNSVMEALALEEALVNNVEKFDLVFDSIIDPCTYNVNQKSLFDVCCGIGGSLRKALDFGFTTVLGCDLNVEHVEIARKYYRVPIVCEEIEDLVFQDSQFTVVMSFHGLEHVRNPRKALRKMLGMSSRLVYLEHPNTLSVEQMERGGHVHEWSFESFEFFVDTLRLEGVKVEGTEMGDSQRWVFLKMKKGETVNI